jgi:two-component system CheB/CheR fusion protein
MGRTARLTAINKALILKSLVKRSPNVPQYKALISSTLPSCGGHWRFRLRSPGGEISFSSTRPMTTAWLYNYFSLFARISKSSRSNHSRSHKNVMRQVTETLSIEKNTVYVISPAHNLMMNDGYPLVSL